MKNIIRRSLELFLAILLALGLLGPVQVQAAPQAAPICIWTGEAGNNWSNAGNWTSAPSPALPCPTLVNGRTVSLAFPTLALNKDTTYNNVLNLNVAGMAFESGGYTLSGNTIFLSNKIINAAGINSVSLPILLTASIDADITGTLHLDGVIGGAFGINKISSGSLDLNAANTFTGGVTVGVGRVTLSQAQAGGSGTLSVSSGATLNVGSSVTFVSNPLTLSGTGSGGSGALHFDGAFLSLFGPMTLATNTTIQNTAGTLALANAVSGSGGLTLDGPAFILSGSQANTFAGILSMPHGVLTLNHAAGVTAVPGSLVLGPGDAAANVQLIAMADNQFSSASQVSLGSYTVINLQGHSQTVGGIVAWDRPCQILLGGDQTVTLTINTTLGPQNYVNCDVTGTGTLLLKGNGMQNFENNDPAAPFNGTISMDAHAAGYLEAFQSTGPLYLHTDGYGVLYAGNKLGSVLAENAWLTVVMNDPASMSQAGSLLLGGASTRTFFYFDATNAGGLKVSGAVELGVAQLSICYYGAYVPGLANTPDNPKQRTLIQKDSAGPVTGSFAGLPEGAQISLITCFPGGTSYPLRLSYQGGDGNDVVVTRLVQDLLSLAVVPSSPGIDQTVQLVATLAPLENAYGAAPSQKVAFYDGNTLLGEASFVGPTTATLTAGPFSLGHHAIQARLVGDPSFADATSNTVSFGVGRSLFVPTIRK